MLNGSEVEHFFNLNELIPDYPVCSFEGRKRVILNTVSWMGVKNPFLGIAYITVGSICFFLGVVLLIHHIWQPQPQR